jgi:hypothetical protein
MGKAEYKARQQRDKSKKEPNEDGAGYPKVDKEY